MFSAKFSRVVNPVNSTFIAMRAAFVFSMVSMPQYVEADCSSPLVNTALKLFNVSSLADLPGTLLDDIQGRCASGHCPNITLPGCGAESLDNLVCEVPVFEVGVKIGTDTICDTACNDWPCKVACNGINTGICYGADFLLCKVGCLGIHKCVDACEHAIVDPCVKVLIDDCSSGCEKAFDSCKTGCEEELTLEITGYFEQLEHVVSSLAINNFDIDCTGNGLTKPLIFNASTSVGIEDLGLALKIHTKDVSIGTTTTVSLQHLKLGLSMPINGSIQCGLLKRQKHIDILVGDASVDDFDLNLDVNNNVFSTIAAVICLDLPFCKDAIQNAIDGAIKKAIVDHVPDALAKVIAPALNGAVGVLQCPGGAVEEEIYVL